jgi:tryptophanyl-tRNA synthetase
MRRIFSGVQPTGRQGPHLGNYMGAFKQWVELQEQHESFLCVVDLHSMTVPWNPGELLSGSRNVAAMLLACGIDPERSVLFLQSEVGEHIELAWILGCISRMGELSRMTQFKDKSRGKEAGSVGAGLFFYPVLMAADVLAYRADLVPVGDDQRQHLELMRDLAQRFNREFGEVFPIPDAYIPEQGARIMSLDDPTQKMSKSSERPAGQVWMLDSPEVVASKIGRAVTDSGREVVSGPDKPAISNLLDIFSGVTGRTVKDLEAEYAGAGYAKFKSDLGTAIAEFLQPIQERYAEFTEDGGLLDKILEDGAQRARLFARETVNLVRERVGLRAL